jgi:hypothetical protein
MGDVSVPVKEINGEKWLLLKHICESFTLRAVKIKHQGRKPDPSGHHMDQAYVKGSVKCKPKTWETSDYKT